VHGFRGINRDARKVAQIPKVIKKTRVIMVHILILCSFKILFFSIITISVGLFVLLYHCSIYLI
jgi:hypothetical protein